MTTKDRSAYQKAYREAHKDHIREIKREYRLKNRKKINAQKRADYHSNIEHSRMYQRVYMRNWYAKNRAKARLYQRRYKKKKAKEMTKLMEQLKEIEYERNPVKAIRAKCLDCCCGIEKEVKLCTSVKCPIWPFRFGKNPYRTTSKREYTEEQREAQRKRMLEMLERKKNGV